LKFFFFIYFPIFFLLLLCDEFEKQGRKEKIKRAKE
jgi:phosphotransferase system  glucose/maltose/N-acetylglucosamine-specific IIC component